VNVHDHNWWLLLAVYSCKRLETEIQSYCLWFIVDHFYRNVAAYYVQW